MSKKKRYGLEQIENLRDAVVLLRAAAEGKRVADAAKTAGFGAAKVSHLMSHVGAACGVDPTAPSLAGARLRDEVRAFLADAEAMLAAHARLFNRGHYGTRKVVVQSIPSVLRSFLPRVVENMYAEGVPLKSAGGRAYWQAFPLDSLRAVSIDSSDRDAFSDLAAGAIDVLIQHPHPLRRDAHRLREVQLFAGAVPGLIFPPNDPAPSRWESAAARSPGIGPDLLASLATRLVFLSGDAASRELEKVLPAPAGRGGRVQLHTYNQIRRAVESGLGVGVGVDLEDAGAARAGGVRVRHLPFAKAFDGAAGVERLRSLKPELFAMYLRGTPDGADQPTPVAAVAECVELAAKGYVHSFVS